VNAQAGATASSTSPELSPRHRTAVLVVMCLALMMVVSAVASLNVALPDIARGTGASQSQLQWIIDAYALVFAGLLLPAGAFGDRYGRKGILLLGLVVFGRQHTDANDEVRPTRYRFTAHPQACSCGVSMNQR
jgi:predicted MFS family arabinose efflux permease